MKAENISKKSGRLRILIIGRAGAGKTTILKRICKTTEDPEIYGDKGVNIQESAEVSASATGHGEYRITCSKPKLNDISNEIVFRSNEDFVFHDSLGAEADSREGFDKTKIFAAERAQSIILSQQIHAIWYCISMERYPRLILGPEQRFFDECSTGNVPVVVVFTKTDAMLVHARGMLTQHEKTLPSEEMLARLREYAKDLLKACTAWEMLREKKYPPKAYVHLKDMHKSGVECKLLLEKTAEVLKEEASLMLLAAAQHSSQ